MNTNFTLAKARDFDVVILKENGWINYTKLCRDLTGNEDKFRSLINKNTSLQILIKSYENLRPENSPVLDFTINNLTKLNILKQFNNYRQVGEINVGTYGPRYMLDFIIMTCNINYYKLIHEALESIDNYTSTTGKSFDEEIAWIKQKYENELKTKDDKISKLEELIKTQNNKIDNLETKIDNQTKTINEQSTKIDNQTKILTEVKQSLTSIADSVTDLNKHITSNVICKYHILLWLDKVNQNKTKSSDDITIKTFVGLIENTPKLSKTDKILLRENVSCSLDSFKQVLANLSNMAFTTNYRNIIIKQYKLESFIAKFKCELIEINHPIESIRDSINNLETTVKEQNTRLDKIENELSLICQFYNITEEKYNEIKNGDWMIKYKQRWRDVKINKHRNKLYVNHGKNNSEVYYLENGEI